LIANNSQNFYARRRYTTVNLWLIKLAVSKPRSWLSHVVHKI